MKLSIHRLHQALVEFAPCNERVGDIIKVLQYCYMEDLDPVPEQLKELLTKYVACNIVELRQNEEF
jgi:hypothetical protein